MTHDIATTVVEFVIVVGVGGLLMFACGTIGYVGSEVFAAARRAFWRMVG